MKREYFGFDAIMYKSWHELVSKYAPTEVWSKMFNTLITNYNSEGRYYHNFRHIRRMLDSLELYKHIISDYDTVRFAIWYHDIIYLTNKRNNEEESAIVAAKELAKTYFSTNKTEKVCSMIRQTKYNHDSEPTDFDTSLFLDIDLQSLGSEPNVYKINTQNIRKEYSAIPNKIFNSKRLIILRSFLNKSQIFFTNVFKQKLEQQARSNILDEIAELCESVDN